MKQKIKRAAAWFGDSSGNVKLSMVIMGAGQFRYGAKGKGVCFFLSEVLMICYMAMRGCRDFAGFFTLGTTRGDAWLGVEGDNSVVMLLMGIFAWIVLAAFVCIYCGNVRDTYRMQKRIEQGKKRVVLPRGGGTAARQKVLCHGTRAAGHRCIHLSDPAGSVHDTHCIYELRWRHCTPGTRGLGGTCKF